MMKKWMIALIIVVFAYCLYAQPGPLQSVITNLTQFKDQTAWRVFYSNTDGDVTELALGTDDQYLKSNGASTAPTWASPADRFYIFNLFNPNSIYDKDTQVCFEPNLPAAITITEVTISCDADPTTELDIDLKWADVFIGLVGATLIEPIDTTNGTTDIDSGFDDATVAAGKCLYVEFAADPDSNITQAIVKIRYDFD